LRPLLKKQPRLKKKLQQTQLQQRQAQLLLYNQKGNKPPFQKPLPPNQLLKPKNRSLKAKAANQIRNKISCNNKGKPSPC
jgi:hypothetical protein